MIGPDESNIIMKYDVLYGDAQAFESPMHLLMKGIFPHPCRVCDDMTKFIDYSFDKPISVCSEECFIQLKDFGSSDE